MGCNCKWTEIIIAIVIFVMVVWPGLLGSSVSNWVVAIAAIALFLHALMCKNCGACASSATVAPKRTRTRKKRKR